MAYTFEQVFAADPANPANIAQNAAITIFAPGDGTMTPLTITDPDGQPLANPLTVNANGFGSAFAHATLDRVAWQGGGFTGFFTSYEGMKEVAVAAQAAAEAAVADADMAVGAVVTAATIDEDGHLILTKADATIVDAGNAKGPTGATGPTGAPGLDGSNVLPTSTAIEQAIINAGPAKTALDTRYGATQANAQNWDALNATALLRFHSALGNVRNAPCNVLFAGHSMMAGFSSTKGADRVAESTVTALRRHVGITGGIGFKKMKHPNAFTDYPITGTLSGLNPYGLGGTDEATWISNTSGPATVAIPAGHTSVDIVYTSNPGNGTFSWALDGGAATNVSTSAALSGWQTTRVTLPDNAAHTLVIQYVSGSSIVNGIMFYNGDETNGIRTIEAARSGNTSALYLSLGMNSSPTTWQDSITALNPALVVFTILCNDYTSGATGANPVSSANSKLNIKAIIDKIIAKCATRPSIVLCVENQRNNIDGSMTEPWANYVQAAYDLAAVEGYAVFDYGKRLGGGAPAAAVAAGLLNADAIHPSNQGHRFWGEAMGAFLAP